MKSLLAVAATAALLPALAGNAGAAGPVTFSRTVVVACFPTAAMAQIGLDVTNPGLPGVVVPKGAKIEIRVWTKEPDGYKQFTIIADKALLPGSANRLKVKRPAGTIMRCAAKATFPRLDSKIITRS